MINKAEEVWHKVKPEFDKYDTDRLKRELGQMSERGRRDVLDKDNWGYYQFLAALVKTLKPKQITELGAAMGVSTLVMLREMPKDGILYSVTLPENGLEFSYIKKEYPQLVKAIGDDLDLTVWPEETDLDPTDLWFIDSEHTAEQLRSEFETYRPFIKRDAIILLDDIKLNDMYQFWLEIEKDKYDASTLHVPSGFGIIVW